MSIDGTYNVQVEVGGKLQSAVVAISTLDDMLFITATDVPVVGTIEANGTIYSDNTFSVSGKINVLFKRITYAIVGRVEGETLSATANTSLGTFNATGVRID